MAIVTMTREMGTLGKEVARELSQRMNYTVIHAELTEPESQRAQRGEESEVYRFLEGSQDELDKWRNNHSSGGYLTPEEIFEIALDGNVLIRGWGATRLLSSVPNILSLRVCAPMEFRIDQMQQRLGIDASMALREIKRNDATHSGIFMRFFGVDWTDPLNYDLVMNTGGLSPSVCTDILCDAVTGAVFAETEECRQQLRDNLLEAKIRSALTGDSRLQRSGRHIHFSVQDASVRLYGLVTDATARQTAEHLVAEQSGVRSVSNEIAHATKFD